MSGIAQQFGFATIPSCSSARAPLTSGTTSGMPGVSRNAADLSTQTAPAAAAAGTSSRLSRRSDGEEADVEVTGAERLRGRLLDLDAVEDVPAERRDANARTFVWPRSRR